jgi:predicted NAD/FAD-binding protein/DUF1365 family protein
MSGEDMNRADMNGAGTSGEAGAAPPPVRRLAVVGSGVAGLTAAYVASRTAHVTLFEADHRLGGHADTHVVDTPDGPLPIDTGFIVHNERTYPTLLRLFAELGVRTQDSEMSMSVRDEATGLEYAGALGRRGLFPGAEHLRDPAYLRMLAEVPRFHRRARRLLAAGEEDLRTLRTFLAEGRFTPYFTRHFMEPLVAAVWSCDPSIALDYPARYLFTFLEHHGMLGVLGSPQWRTVAGGSHEYVARVGACLDEVRTGTKVTSVLEAPDGVEVTDGNGGTHVFDAVVLATHPDQALAMLAEPTPAQREVLGAMPYSANTAQLHTDTSLLPRLEDARASWNFLRRDEGRHGPGGGRGDGAVTVTYDLTRLMRLPVDGQGTRYLVTLGGTDLVDPDRVLDTMEYAHPIYSPESVAAQRRLGECESGRVVLAGAYHGWGFHEDGARSGLAAVTRLGLPWPEPGRVGGAVRAPVLPVARPGLYRTTIDHTRRGPLRRRFTHRSHVWLVDLDAVPDHGPLGGTFEARDHLGDPEGTLRDNVERFLAAHDVDLGGGRILMAAQPRAYGYCFNPISVFWCFRRATPPRPGVPDALAGPGARAALAAVVVEVHNTYGDRHAYLVVPDAQGRARTAKLMYVSPFHGTDGHYELAVPVPRAADPGDPADRDSFRVAVTLHPDPEEAGGSGDAVFSASLAATRVDAASRRDVRAAAAAALRGAALIRAHGVWLWARRLPVRPRPEHPPQEGVR